MAVKKTKQTEVLQLLDDLDSFTPASGIASSTTQPTGSNEGEAAEVLAFLDEITQKSTEPTRPTTVHISRSSTPISRKSTERVRLGGGSTLHPSASSSTASLSRTLSIGKEKSIEQPGLASSQPGGGDAGVGWGWGSVWSSASAAIQQARSVVDEQVKYLPKNEQARKWGEGVIEYAKSAQLDKLSQDFKRVGLSTLTDILNVVAPPISEHEVIQVWLSHDMQGYEGVESLVYQALTRILEQVQGGDLVLNRGNESRPKDGLKVRDLNAVDGYETALKVAQVNIDDMIKSNQAAQQTRNPNLATTYSHVFLRIQPFYTTLDHLNKPKSAEPQHLQFLMYLFDPAHGLAHTTVTQVVLSSWIALWDEYDWVEELVAETIRLGAEMLGQEYVVARMGWGAKEDQGKDTSASVDPGEHHDKPEPGS